MKITKDMVSKSPVYPENIWNLLEDFSSYAFNKSHAVAYTLISYMTARIWTYHRDEFLEYEMNYSGRMRRDKAIKKCKKIGMKIQYPTLETLGNKEYRIIDNCVYVPGRMEQSFDSVGEFMFSSMVGKQKAIQMGVLDEWCKDRENLSELVKSLGTKGNNPGFPATKTLTETFDAVQMAGIFNWSTENGKYIISIPKRRGEPKVITLSRGLTNSIADYNIGMDIKHFATVRPGLLDDQPTSPVLDILMAKVETYRNRLKDKLTTVYEQYTDKEIVLELSNYYQANNVQDLINIRIKDSLTKQVKKFLYDHETKLAKLQDHPHKVVLNEVRNFPKYMKVTLLFADGEQLFFVRDNAIRDQFLKMNKKDVCKVWLQLDWYVSKNLELIMNWKIVKIGEDEVVLGVEEDI